MSWAGRDRCRRTMGCALSRLPCIRGWLLSPAPALIVARRRAELRRVRVPAGAGARVALPVILPEEPGPDFSHIDHTLLVFKNGRRSGPLGAIPLAERLRTHRPRYFSHGAPLSTSPREARCSDDGAISIWRGPWFLDESGSSIRRALDACRSPLSPSKKARFPSGFSIRTQCARRLPQEYVGRNELRRRVRSTI